MTDAGAAGAAGVAVAAITAVSAVVSALLNAQARRRTAQNEKAANILAAYGQLVGDLQAELDRERTAHLAELERRTDEVRRHVLELGRSAEQLAACEERCRECREQLADLLANFRALAALVRDEVTAAAAEAVLGEHAAEDELDVEQQRIRDFIERLPREDRE